MKIMKKFFISLLASICSFGTLQAQETAYLFSYFINDSRDGLHLAYSRDGQKWTALNNGNSYLAPAVGKDKLMRDPSICQAPDGTFHMVWTSSWTDRIIGYASSKDLINWSEQRAIPVMMHEPEAHNCWAPELFYDEPTQTYYIFWATTIPGRHKEVPTSESEKGLNHRIYYVTTKDFKEFSSTQMFFNPDFSVIDAAIVKDNKSQDLIMVVKNENSNPPEKNLRITRSRDITHGFPTEVLTRLLSHKASVTEQLLLWMRPCWTNFFRLLIQNEWSSRFTAPPFLLSFPLYQSLARTIDIPLG